MFAVRALAVTLPFRMVRGLAGWHDPQPAFSAGSQKIDS
jgi:hypothetical protein